MMKKIIVTTTINPPTEAIRKYEAMEDWELLVIGDVKTPMPYCLERGLFLSIGAVEDHYPDLVNLIGKNSVRLGRMVGFIEAYKRGADIIASIDDDCMPNDNWGKGIILGSEVVGAREFKCDKICWDPFEPHSYTRMCHRGFPLELNQQAMDFPIAEGWREGNITPLVWESHCHGDSDFNAIDRLSGAVDYYEDEYRTPYFADCFSPINTQNTFIHRSVIKDFYANIPFVGRADDIWAGYIFQALHPRSTVYGVPSATHEQERSVQSLINDLEDEIFMYRNTYPFLTDLRVASIPHVGFPSVSDVMRRYLPEKSLQAINLYRGHFK